MRAKHQLSLHPLVMALLLALGFMTSIMPVPAHASTYEIGDTGPAGGLIFHIEGDTYYEAAPYGWSGGDDPDAEWGCSETELSGAEGKAIGTGEQNTADIEASCATSGNATDLAANLSLNDYDDWFLPSLDELYAMRNNL